MEDQERYDADMAVEKFEGFASPTYTQMPNDFFKMIPLMGEPELRVTLIALRETFGGITAEPGYRRACDPKPTSPR